MPFMYVTLYLAKAELMLGSVVSMSKVRLPKQQQTNTNNYFYEIIIDLQKEAGINHSNKSKRTRQKSLASVSNTYHHSKLQYACW